MVVLPLPDSPTSATHSPGWDAEAHAGDRGGQSPCVRYFAVRHVDASSGLSCSRAGGAERTRGSGFPPASAADDVVHGDLIGGGSSAAHVGRSSQRGAKGTPGPVVDSGATPGMPVKRAAVVVGHARDQSRVYGCRGWVVTTVVGACSTILPAYMTATGRRPGNAARSCET